MRYLALLFVLLNSFNAASQSKQAREYLSVLTSDSLAGRGFSEKGQEKAADFIIRQLEKSNVKAAGENGFKQELSYPVNIFSGRVEFSEIDSKSEKMYSAGRDYLFHPASARMDLCGRIQHVMTDFQFSENSTDQIYYVEKTADNAKEIAELSQRFLFETTSRDNLLIIRDSAKWNWFPSGKQSANAIVYVKDALENGTEIAATNQAYFSPNFRSSNVIGKIEGERSDSVMMLSAHYDHLGKMGDAIFRGANDNASGVAMLLTLAEYYGKHQPKFDTYFLFTTAEEIGLLGSYYFIQNPVFDLRKIKMLVNLDMVGTGDEGITVVNAKKQNRYFDLLTRLNKGRISEIKARGEACNSDHCLFDRIGVPAIFIYTLGGKQAYHDIYDNGEDLSLEAFDDLHDLIIESLNQF